MWLTYVRAFVRACVRASERVCLRTGVRAYERLTYMCTHVSDICFTKNIYDVYKFRGRNTMC